jgi:hypothetical protein
VSQEAPGVASLPSDAPATSAAIVAGILPCACGCGRLLSGRQTKYASKDCANKLYAVARPRILNASAGAPREGTIKQAVLACLVDGRWWSYHELAAACRADKHSIVSRVSELHRAGHRIEFDLPRGNSRRGHRVRLLTGAAA